MAFSNSDGAYKAEVRHTGTRGFGDSSVSQSYRGTDPEELLTSAESGVNDYRLCVESLKRSDTIKKGQESQQLRVVIKEKLLAAEQEIKGKQAHGESRVIIKRLSTHLSNLIKQFEQLIQIEKQKMTEEQVEQGGGQAESTFVDSFSGSDPTVNETEGDTLAQEALQVNESALGERQRQSENILVLERDITDLNEISKDLNVMIVDQGEGVERIELKVEKAATRTEKGTAHTTTAVALSRQNKTLLIVVLSIGAVVAVVIIIIVIILAVVLSRN